MAGDRYETLTIDLTLLTGEMEDLNPTETIRVEVEDDEVYEPLPATSSSFEDSLVLGVTLGQGGMAIVREAQQRVLARSVAVKSAHLSSEQVRGRLVQEAQITGALEHPSIVPVHDILVDADGRPHIVLQRLDGDAWEKLIDDEDGVFERFGTRDMLGWNIGVLEAVCNAIHFAHQKGIVHRDLKPDNVMVGGFGQVYVLDWGIAVSVREDERRFPRAQDQTRIAGTPRYMAPEMLTGDGRISPATDIYLLGALLFRILAGQPPHRGLGVTEILGKIPEFEPVLPDAPEELVDLVRMAMALEPADRPETAEVFRRRLHAFVEHRGALEMAAQAQATLQELSTLILEGDVNRVEAYDLFGACRFGFRAALDAWTGNDAAADGLEKATMLMAQWELDQGDDRAAEVLLGALQGVPDEVRSQLDRIREERVAGLNVIARLAQDRDPRTGQRIRLAAIFVFTALWTVSPWLARDAGSGTRFALSTGWLVVLLVLLLLGGKDWIRTSANRRTASLLGLALATQFLLIAGSVAGAIPMEHARTALQAVNAGFVGASGMLINRRFWIPAAVFAGVFLSKGIAPEWTGILATLATLSLGGTAAWVWWPARKP